MKKLSRILFYSALLLLFVAFIASIGRYWHGVYLSYVAEKNQEAFNDEQQNATRSGNGFGGDEGMNVIDSGYRSDKFFWIDEDHLLFRTEYSAYAPRDVQREYVWNTEELTIKPLMIDGGINSFYDGKLYFTKASESELLPNGRRKPVFFRARLRELDDAWVIEHSENMENVIADPPDRHELAWREGKPWYRLKTKLRSGADVPPHRFRYLWEWGWILRLPEVGPQHFGQADPEMGFFDLGGELYAGQPGVKVADLVDLAPDDYINLDVIYVSFLDKYWLANDFYGGKPKRKFLGLIDRTGRVQKLEWPESWPEYSGIPMPTRKGLFWSGRDYRMHNPTRHDEAAFVRDPDGRVHKALKGNSLRPALSSDGCRVAFLNLPRPDTRSGASLKVFNVCKSTTDGEVLTDVDY